MSLRGDELRRVAGKVADGLSATTSGYPFTQHLRVWNVVEKVFLIITEDDPTAPKSTSHFSEAA